MSELPIDQIILGDNMVTMKSWPDGQIDALVSDPPYGLSFMGRNWDKGVPAEPFWREAYRVLKPGAYCLAFGGSRTFHRMGVAIEDAGFEIRDCLSWLYGSGFPKNHDVSKAIDKKLGVEREVVGTTVGHKDVDSNSHGWAPGVTQRQIDVPHTKPGSPEAQEWDGWGTALKPSWEPIIMARKPCEGTVAENVMKYGTGAINIDGNRIGESGGAGIFLDRDAAGNQIRTKEERGRWPANTIFDGSDEAMAGLPDEKDPHTGEIASVSRYFYCAKPSMNERNEGLGNLPDVKGGVYKFGEDGSMGNKIAVKKNIHPTVKPVQLMRHLVRMVCKEGGIVFDPFSGSGTTLVAAIKENCRFLGCEITPDYAEIAQARIVKAQGSLGFNLGRY